MTTNDPNHADTCASRHNWLIAYVSKDEHDHVVALEINCAKHNVQWWFPAATKEGA